MAEIPVSWFDAPRNENEPPSPPPVLALKKGCLYLEDWPGFESVRCLMHDLSTLEHVVLEPAFPSREDQPFCGPSLMSPSAWIFQLAPFRAPVGCTSSPISPVNCSPALRQ